MELKNIYGDVIFATESAKTVLELVTAARAANANLNYASLDGANLDGASLDGASLDGASLDGASLDGASLDGASLDGASLDGASLDGASLNGASLDGASLNGASLNCASLDGASLETARQLTYVNCGQQPVIIVRTDGGIERLSATALPLGLVTDWTAEVKTVELRAGDAVYLCSDGVVEAGIERGCEFGEDGLLSMIAGAPDQGIESSVARIARAVCAYSPGGPTDDVTIVGLRFF